MRGSLGVVDGEVGRDCAALDLSGRSGDAVGERAEHVVAGDPALQVLAVVGEHRQPVVAVEDELA